MKTLLQQVTGTVDKHIDYDFEARQKRRRLNGIYSMNLHEAQKNLFEVNQVFRKYDCEFFLLYGTLLGAIREGSLIEHDTDIDLGVLDINRDSLILALKELVCCGFQIIRTREPDDRVTIIRNDEYIDFGILEKKSIGGRAVYQYSNNYIDAIHLKDLDSVNFLGKDFKVPADSHLLLEKWYGPNWRSSIKGQPAVNNFYETGELKIILKKIKFIKRSLISLAKKILCNKSFCLLAWLLGGVQVKSRKGIYNAEYGSFKTIGSAYFPVDSLKVVHFTDGLISIVDCPHIKFCASVMAGDETFRGWHDYVIRQHGDIDLVDREDRFKNIIKIYKEEQVEFEICVSLGKGGVVVVDGFHRVSIVKFFGRKKYIKCHIIAF